MYKLNIYHLCSTLNYILFWPAFHMVVRLPFLLVLVCYPETRGSVNRHNTLRRHLYIMGLINSSWCRRKPQLTFCVSVKCWQHSDIRIWVPFVLEPEDVRGQSVTLLKEQGSHYLDISLRGIKDLSKRPKWIGTKRLKSLYYSILTAAQPRFDPRRVCAGYVEHKVAIAHFFSPSLPFHKHSTLINVPTLLHHTCTRQH
jgi:hypothetical protein